MHTPNRVAARTPSVLAVPALVASLVALAAAPAQAQTLSFTPTDAVVLLGDTIELDIVLSDRPAAAPVGFFDLDGVFDPAVLSFTGLSLSDAPGDIGLGQAVNASLPPDPVNGVLNLAVLSLLPDLSAQPLSPVLGRVSFSAIGLGAAGVGFGFGEEAARGEIYGQLHGRLGSTGALAVQGLLDSAGRRAGSVSAAAIGGVVLFIGAISVFAELQDALDRIWRVPQRAGHGGLQALVRARLLSFGMILGIGFLLIVSLAFSAALIALSRWWNTDSQGWTAFTCATELSLNFVLLTAAFAMIY